MGLFPRLWELTLLTILGITRGQLNRLIFLENILAANEAALVSSYVEEENSRTTAKNQTVKLGEESFTIATVVDANIFPKEHTAKSM